MDPINPMAFWQDQNTLYSPKDDTEGEAKFNQWLQTPGSASDYGVGSRLLYGAIAAPGRAIEGLSQSAGNIASWIGGPASADDAITPSLPPGRTGGQQAADLAGAIAPVFLEGAGIAGPLSNLSRMTGLAKAYPTISRALVTGGEFAGLSAVANDPTTTGEQFGEGAASGLITSLMPRGIGRTVAAGALGLASQQFFDRNDGEQQIGNFTQGQIQGAALGLATAFMGKPQPKWTKPVIGELPVKTQPAPTVDYNLRNKIDSQTGVINPMARSAQSSAEAMQAAWGFDPNATNTVPNSPGYSAADSAAFMQQMGPGRIPEMQTPDPALQSLQLTSRTGMLAEQQARRQFMPQPGPEVPLLQEANLNQYSNKPVEPIQDLAAPQSQQQVLNRTPGNTFLTPFGYRETPVTVPLEGPIGKALEPPPVVTPERIKQEVLNPANQQLVYNAAFGGIDPGLQHQSSLGLQALHTEMIAKDVLQGNRQQTHDFVSWMHGLEDKPTVSGADPLTKLARSPNVSVDDLATELRQYSPSEREAIGRELGVRPDDTLGMAEALKERYDPSRAPRKPPEQKFSDAELHAMMLGDPEFPHLTEGEADVRRGMNRGSAEEASTHMAQLYAGARGVIGGLAGYAEGQRENRSEGEKWLMAATLGGAAAFGPAAFRGLKGIVHGGEAEARIPTWGGRQVQRTALSIDAPPRNTENPRLNELQQIQWDKAAAIGDVDTLQRLQNETTVKGKVSSIPEYMRREGGGVGGVGAGIRKISEGDSLKVLIDEVKSKDQYGKFRSNKDLLSRLPEKISSMLTNWETDWKRGNITKMNRYMTDTEKVFIRSDSDYTAYNPETKSTGTLQSMGDMRGNLADILPGHSIPLPEGMVVIEKSYLSDGTPTFKINYNSKIPEGRRLEGGMTKRQTPFGEAGSESPEMRAAMGRAVIGGLIGGTAGAIVDDPGSHTGLMAGTIGGALLAMAGPALIRRALQEHATATAPDLAAVPPTKQTGSTTVGTPSFKLGNMIARAQLAEHMDAGSASILDKTLNRLDKYLGTSQGEVFTRLKLQAKGPAEYFTQMADKAVSKMAWIDVDQQVKDLTNQFFNGELPKDEYLKQMSVDSKNKAYADFATVAKDAKAGLQQIGSHGQGNSQRTELMNKTLDSYITRSWRMFTDTSYSPSDMDVKKLAQKLVETNAWGENKTESQLTDSLRQWITEVKRNKGIYRPASGTKIDQSVFEHGKDWGKDPAAKEWAAFLGEITNPIDRIKLTVLKLKPVAQASEFLHQVANGLNRSDEGLKLAFGSEGEKMAEQAKTLEALKNDPNNGQLRKQLLELQQYKYVPQDATYGALQGQYVHRNVFDVLNDWNQTSALDSGPGRALMGLNQLMKSNVTYRNPMSIIHQVVSSPFFMTIGKGWSQAGEALNIMKAGMDHPMMKELFDNGIIGADAISKDVLRDSNRISGGLLNGVSGSEGANTYLGRVDATIAKLGLVGKLTDSKLAEAFKFPNNLTRVATYLAAKVRAADELGLSLSSQDVINKAVEHTNRYTHFYTDPSKAVLAARNVPFVNQFISYASEMTRILKNLGEDLVTGDSGARMHAVMSLGMLFALPEAAQRLSESNLSDKDKKEWEQVKAGLPDYQKDNYLIVQGRDQASGKFRVYNINLLSPAKDFSNVTRALIDGRVKDAALNNPMIGLADNPAMNIAGSFMAGRDRFTQRQLRGPGDYFATVAKEIGGPLTPGVGSTVQHFQQAYYTNDQGRQGITDKLGRSITPSDFWLGTLSTIKAMNIDPKVIQSGVMADYKQRAANEIAFYNDIAKSTQPADVKAKALERLNEALKQLQNNLYQHLGVKPPQ